MASSADSSPDNNYLRVTGAIGQRRFSDNVLSGSGGGGRRTSNCGLASGAAGGSAPESPIAGSGFHMSRRHSSAAFAANRRYSSNALLSPLQSSNQVGTWR